MAAVMWRAMAQVAMISEVAPLQPAAEAALMAPSLPRPLAWTV